MAANYRPYEPRQMILPSEAADPLLKSGGTSLAAVFVSSTSPELVALPSRRLRTARPPHGGRHAPPPRVAPALTPERRRAPRLHPRRFAPQGRQLPRL